jgi:hypothetical protein
MSGVQPTLIDYQGITMNNSSLERSVILTMDGSSQGLILQYDKQSADPKQFTITQNGINYTDTTNNYTTSLEKLALVQDTFQAVELPPNATTLQIKNRLHLNDSVNSVSGNISLDASGNITMDASGNLVLNPVGTINASGKVIDLSGGEIHNCDLLQSDNNTDIIIEGKGTGDVILKTGNTNRLTISDDGAWTVQGGMSYDNSANILTAGTFAGTAAIGQLNVTNDNSSATRFPIFASTDSSSADIYIDSVTGPLTYDPSAGVMSFPNPPTCDISANAVNQLANFNNFADVSWNPTISGGGNAGDPNYTTRLGRYVRINNLCIFQAEIAIDSSGNMSGQVQVSVPFTNNANVPGSLTIGVLDGMGATAAVEFSAGLNGNLSIIGLGYRPANNSASYSNLLVSNIDTSNFRIRYGGSYVCQ